MRLGIMTAIIGPPYCFFFVVSFQYLDHNIRVFTHQDSSWRVNDNQCLLPDWSKNYVFISVVVALISWNSETSVVCNCIRLCVDILGFYMDWVKL